MPITKSSWVMPIVATVTTIRGELRKRRINANSMTTPATTDMTSPLTSPSRYGQPQNNDERGSERSRHGSELGLGEVDHPVGPIDQRHADRHHCVQPAQHQTVQPQAERETEEDQLDTDDRGDRTQGDGAIWVDVADTRSSHAATVAVSP